jgi:MFS family permease
LALASLRRLAPATNGKATPSTTLASLQLTLAAALAMFGLQLADLTGIVLVIGGIVMGLPALTKLLPAGTLRGASGLPAGVATVGLLGFAFFAAEAFLPLSLTEIRAQPATMAGLALTAATITWTAGAWLQARWATSTSRRLLTAVGLLLIALGVAGVATAVLSDIPVAIAIAAWALTGFGMGIAYTTATLVVLELAEPGSEGASSSGAQLANVLGIALGTGIGGAIVAWSITPQVPTSPGAIAAVDALAIAIACLGLVTARRLPKGPPRA